MDATEMRVLMERIDPFDHWLLLHGYKPYMRDYALLVEMSEGPPSGPGVYEYLFGYCVESRVRTALSDEAYLESLDERLTDYEAAGDTPAFVWGVNSSRLYPGWELVADSPAAAEWSRRLGLEFHEVVVETDAYVIRLVFRTLSVSKVSDERSTGVPRWRYVRG